MARKDNKDVRFEIEASKDIEVTIDHNKIIMKKGENHIERKIDQKIKIDFKEDKISLEIKKAKKQGKRNIGTARGHVQNMVKGLEEGFEYELEIANAHFPMTAEVDKAKKEIIVKNLIGERAPRVLKFGEGVEVEINAPKIVVRSFDIEKAGTVASNIEKLTKIRNKDRNKFQDGIFITKKPGKEYL